MMKAADNTEPQGVVKFAIDHPVLSFVTLSIVAAACFLVYGWCLPSLIRLIGDWSPSDSDPIGYKGLFGDSFGALTSFFTVLALMALLLTFIYQKRQLDLQKRQLDDERKLAKYQQIPLLSIDHPCLLVEMPFCKKDCTIGTYFSIDYGLKAGNEFLIKNAYLKIELRCGPQDRREVLVHCRSFAGIGAGAEPSSSDDIEIAGASFLAFSSIASQIAVMDEPPIVISMTVYYQSMVGLNIRLHREYRVGEAEKNAANVVRMWGERLATAPNLRGSYNEDFYTCLNHFRVSMSGGLVRFSLIEMTEAATFEVIKDNRFEQEVEAVRRRING